MNHKKYFLFFYLLLFNLGNIFACDCTPKLDKVNREESYKYSRLVFLGEFRKENLDANSYSFEVLEVFKGDIRKSQIIRGRQHSSCSRSSFVDGLWLVYATVEDDSLIDISICGASRGINMPFISPPILPKQQKNELDSLNGELSIMSQKYKALTDWITDLESYRQRKPQIEKLESIEVSTIVTVCNSILLILLIIYIFLNKNASR
jgi:hypothetical protein